MCTYLNNLCFVHKRAVRHIAKYLVSTSTHVDLPGSNRWLTTRGAVYRQDIEKFIECYVDANFSGGWAQLYANAKNVIARTGYIITYARCTVLWCSNLQT